MRFTGGNDIVFRDGGLHHEPHGFHIISGITPVAASLEVSKVKLFLQAELNASRGAGNFSGHKGLTPTLTFMVKENSVGGKEAVALTIVAGDKVSVSLGTGVGRPRVEFCTLSLRCLFDLAVELGR